MLLRGPAERLPPAGAMAQALVSRDHRVDFFECHSTQYQSQDSANLRYLTIPVPWSPEDRTVRKLAQEIGWGREFTRRTPPGSYDLLFAHNTAAIPWTAAAARRLNVPWIYQAHEYLGMFEGRLLTAAYLVLERILIPSAALVICPHPSRAERMQRDHQLARRPLVVMNTVPLRDRIRDERIRHLLREGAGGTGRIILYQGGIRDNDIFRALIRSVAGWPLEDHLAFIGWGDSGAVERLEAFAGESGVRDRTHFHPAMPHESIWPFICAGDIGLILYKPETLNETYAAPNKLGEYLMAGLPVIYFPTQGLSKLLEGKAFAVPLEFADEGSFVAALRSLRGKSLVSASAAAREAAEVEYNFGVQSSGALDAIEQIVRGRR